MREIVLVCVAALVASCGTHNVPASSTRGIPYLRSQLTVAETAQVLRMGMSSAEVSHAIASIPYGGMYSTLFLLADGYLICQWASGKLLYWSIRKDCEATQEGAEGAEANRTL